jgi:hypothetical protein
MPKPVGQRKRTVPYRTSHSFNPLALRYPLHEPWMESMVRHFTAIRALNITRNTANPEGTLREDELNTLRNFAHRSSPMITIVPHIGPPAGDLVKIFGEFGNTFEMKVRVNYRNMGPAVPPLRVIRFVRAAIVKRKLETQIEVVRTVPGYLKFKSVTISKGKNTTEQELNSLATTHFGAAWGQSQWEFDGPSKEFDGGMSTGDDPGDNFAMRPYAIRTQFVTVLYNEGVSTILEVGVSDSSLLVDLGVPGTRFAYALHHL